MRHYFSGRCLSARNFFGWEKETQVACARVRSCHRRLWHWLRVFMKGWSYLRERRFEETHYFFTRKSATTFFLAWDFFLVILPMHAHTVAVAPNSAAPETATASPAAALPLPAWSAAAAAILLSGDAGRDAITASSAAAAAAAAMAFASAPVGFPAAGAAGAAAPAPPSPAAPPAEPS